MLNEADRAAIAGGISGDHGVFGADDVLVLGEMAVLRPGAATSDGTMLSGEDVQRLLGHDWQVFPVALAYAPDPREALACFGNDETEEDLAEMEKALEALDATPASLSGDALGREVSKGIRRRYLRVLKRFEKCQRRLLSGKGRIPTGFYLHPTAMLIGLFAKKDQKLMWQARRCDSLFTRLKNIRERMFRRGIDVSSLPDPTQVKLRIVQEHNRVVGSGPPSAAATPSTSMPYFQVPSTPIQPSAPIQPTVTMLPGSQPQQGTYTPVSQAYLRDQAALERELSAVMPSYYGEDGESLAADLRAEAPGFLFSGVEHDYYGLGDSDVALIFSDEEDLLEEDEDAMGAVGRDLDVALLALRRNNLRLRLRIAQVAREPDGVQSAIQSRLAAVERKLASSGERMGATWAAPPRPTPKLLRGRAKNLALRARLAQVSGASDEQVQQIRERCARVSGRLAVLSGQVPPDLATSRRGLRGRLRAAVASGNKVKAGALRVRLAKLQGIAEGEVAAQLPVQRDTLAGMVRRGGVAGASPRRRAVAARASSALVSKDEKLPAGLARRLNLRRTQLLKDLSRRQAEGKETVGVAREIANIDRRLRNAAPTAGLDPSRLMLRGVGADGPVVLAVGIRRRNASGAVRANQVRSALRGLSLPANPQLIDVFGAQVSQGYSSLEAMDTVRRTTSLADWVHGSSNGAFPLGGEPPLPPPRRAGEEVWA